MLYSKNPDLRHANASTTKLMTAILALENCKLTEKVTASANAAAQEPTKLYLQQGESFVLKDLLYSLLIPSHNDTAVALAEHVSGSVPKFVKLMNKKQQSWDARIPILPHQMDWMQGWTIIQLPGIWQRSPVMHGRSL